MTIYFVCLNPLNTLNPNKIIPYLLVNDWKRNRNYNIQIFPSQEITFFNIHASRKRMRIINFFQRFAFKLTIIDIGLEAVS